MKTIVLTGGGTAGHAMVNIVLIPYLILEGWKIIYIGSHTGIEKQLLSQFPNVAYYGIATGKLRRYCSLENFKDVFRLLKGTFEATKIIYKYKPHIVFSSGGFVSVPVVIAGWINRIPLVIRETDYTCGLANRIVLPFVNQVCVSFPDTLSHLPRCKRQYYGPIVRLSLLEGDYGLGLTLTQFSGEKPILLIMGGSQGSQQINELVRDTLPTLLEKYDVIHLCGHQDYLPNLHQSGYRSYAYVNEELSHLYAIADLVITRSGSNALFEGIALKKPMLLLPLSKRVSRGDQILNAQYACSKGYAKMLIEENLTANTFLNTIDYLYTHRSTYISNLNTIEHLDSIVKQLECINRWAKK